MRLKTLILLSLILLLAAFLRFLDLRDAPLGGHGDVAWVGINALDLVDNGVYPFYVRELYSPQFPVVYTVGLLIEITGHVSYLTSRLMTAISGVIFVGLLFPATWWLMASQPVSLRWRASMLASLSGAVSLHAMYLSRLGMESPPFLALLTLLIWITAWAWHGESKGRWILAGMVLGICQYSYLPSRVLPLMLTVWIGYVYWTQPNRVQWRGWLLMAITAFIVTLPVIILFITTPEAMTGRADTGTATTGGWIWRYDTSAEGGLVLTLIKKLALTLQAFGIYWDGPYTILNQPMLGAVFFIGFLVAFGLFIQRPKDPALGWSWLAIPVMLIPDLLSGAVVEIHALHQMGSLPFAFILSGIGLAYGWEWIRPTSQRSQQVAAFIGLSAAILPSLWGLHLYLDEYIPDLYADPETGWRWEQIDVDLSNAILEQPDRAYLISLGDYNRANIAWLLSDKFRERRSAIDANGILQIPPLPDTLTLLMADDPYRARHDARESQFDPRLWILLIDDQALLLPPLHMEQVQTFIGSAQSETIRDRSNSVIGTFYTAPTPLDWFTSRSVIDYPVEATFEEANLELVGYTLPNQDLTPGEVIFITLFWKTTGERPPRDYEIFVQLWNDQQQSFASTHDFPYDGVYRTRIWRNDEIVPTHHWVRLPNEMPFGRYTLVTGLFQLLHNERLPAIGQHADTTLKVVRIPDLRYPLPPAEIEPGTPPQIPIQFGSFFEVMGMDVSIDGTPQPVQENWQAKAGQVVTVEIIWETLERPLLDYSIFLHLEAEPNTPPVAQADLVMGGIYPTGAWRTGDNMKDVVTLNLPADLAPGTYIVWMGLYHWQTNERLPVVLDGEEQPEQRFQLATITIER